MRLKSRDVHTTLMITFGFISAWASMAKECHTVHKRLSSRDQCIPTRPDHRLRFFPLTTKSFPQKHKAMTPFDIYSSQHKRPPTSSWNSSPFQVQSSMHLTRTAGSPHSKPQVRRNADALFKLTLRTELAHLTVIATLSSKLSVAMAEERLKLRSGHVCGRLCSQMQLPSHLKWEIGSLKLRSHYADTSCISTALTFNQAK